MIFKNKKDEKGSLKEISYTALPLVLAYFSTNMMLLFDRLVLANYSFSAMNAVAAAGIICTVFLFGVISVAAISEVFVGKFNGGFTFSKIGPAIWQMLWFSLFTIPFFFLIATFCGKFLLTKIDFETHGHPYFQWLLYFGPFFGFNAALTGFFIGLRRLKLVTTLAFLANSLNIVLNFVLVFGFKDYIPSMGAKGAAIATGISQVFIFVVLFSVFISKKNHNMYSTRESNFNSSLFWHSLKIGVPAGLSYMIDIIALAVIYQLCILTSETHMALMAFSQSLYSIAVFCLEGINKAVTAISANYMGARSWIAVRKTFLSGLHLLLILFSIFSIFLVIYPDFLIHIFLAKVENVKEYDHLFHQLKWASLVVWVYFLLDGVGWISGGIITASEDTLFLASVNAFSVLTIALIPSYFIVYYFHLDPLYCWCAFVSYTLFNSSCFYLRYQFLLRKASSFEMQAQSS
jgi:multidrug resistance protein, MATE family